MDPVQKLNEDFKKYIQAPFEKWDIIEGALLVARQEYPGLEIEKYKTTVDEMTRGAVNRLAGALGKKDQLDRLNAYFFGELGFEGERNDYYDPRNSYLPDVLDRRRGIPISLSALYLRLAWGAGIPLYGVNFPGHFLVVYKESNLDIEKNLYVDVFNGGKVLGLEEMKGLLSRSGRRVEKLEPATHLRNAGVLQILHRLLGNLKAIHASQGRVERALWAAEWMMLLLSNDWECLRDKGLFCYSLGRLEEAEKALSTYLEHYTHARDFSKIWNILAVIRVSFPANLN